MQKRWSSLIRKTNSTDYSKLWEIEWRKKKKKKKKSMRKITVHSTLGNIFL